MDTYPIHFREEILKPFFDYVRAGDSFCVIGAPSVGKTRLMDFLLGDDPELLRKGITPDRERVKKHYLSAEAAAKTWLARVDMNRMRSDQDWGFLFHELLLNTLLYTSSRLESTKENEDIKNNLANLDAQVIESGNSLKAHRFLEMTINQLCHFYGIKICFLFDEFDDTYKSMPHDVLAQLRAIRDANKYMVSYALFMRKTPEKLRDPEKNEGFYELLRHTLGIVPYSHQDTLYIIEQVEKRHEKSLPTEDHERIYLLSGGHPGYIQALFNIFLDQNQTVTIADLEYVEWFARQEPIREESRKIWIGLLEDEQEGLKEFAHGNQKSISAETGKILLTKGLLVKSTTGNTIKVFSPLFAHWVAKQ